jgi:hypothetical protein
MCRYLHYVSNPSSYPLTLPTVTIHSDKVLPSPARSWPQRNVGRSSSGKLHKLSYVWASPAAAGDSDRVNGPTRNIWQCIVI